MIDVDGEFFPLMVGITLILYSLISYRLSRAAQPLRLHFAERGEALLSNRALPDPMRSHVKFLLETSFGMRPQLLLALVLIPIIAVIFVVRNRIVRTSVEAVRVSDPILQKEFDEVSRLHDRITLANHFLLLPLVELEMVIFMPPAILIRGVIKGMLPDSDGREILNLIENRHIRFVTPQRVAANNR